MNPCGETSIHGSDFLDSFLRSTAWSYAPRSEVSSPKFISKMGKSYTRATFFCVIDPRPYEIKLEQANAQLHTAEARVALANNQLSRSQSLQRESFATQETVDQRINEKHASEAAVEDAKARIQDAQLDLEYTRVTAPFTGRIGARQVSIGDLIAGSRAAISPTTLLATLVSLDPLYLDFDMSESDYLEFSRERARRPGPLADNIAFGLSDETNFKRRGTLDFVDNALDRSSGTIHARATVPNSDQIHWLQELLWRPSLNIGQYRINFTLIKVEAGADHYQQRLFVVLA